MNDNVCPSGIKGGSQEPASSSMALRRHTFYCHELKFKQSPNNSYTLSFYSLPCYHYFVRLLQLRWNVVTYHLEHRSMSHGTAFHIIQNKPISGKCQHQRITSWRPKFIFLSSSNIHFCSEGRCLWSFKTSNAGVNTNSQLGIMRHLPRSGFLLVRQGNKNERVRR